MPWGFQARMISKPRARSWSSWDKGSIRGLRFRHAQLVGFGLQRLRPNFSWDDTHSREEMAAPRESSPARTTPAMISASLQTFPEPRHPSTRRHSCWVGRPCPRRGWPR